MTVLTVLDFEVVACMPNIDSPAIMVEIERDRRCKLIMKLIVHTI
jgi:hypothetical protein